MLISSVLQQIFSPPSLCNEGAEPSLAREQKSFRDREKRSESAPSSADTVTLSPAALRLAAGKVPDEAGDDAPGNNLSDDARDSPLNDSARFGGYAALSAARKAALRAGAGLRNLESLAAASEADDKNAANAPDAPALAEAGRLRERLRHLEKEIRREQDSERPEAARTLVVNILSRQVHQAVREINESTR